MKTEMDSKEFVNTGWMIMKPFYLKDTAEQTKSHEQEAKVPEFGMPETLPEPSHENEENQVRERKSTLKITLSFYNNFSRKQMKIKIVLEKKKLKVMRKLRLRTRGHITNLQK